MAQYIHLLYGVYLFYVHTFSPNVDMGENSNVILVTYSWRVHGNNGTFMVYLDTSQSW
jgi:hypothetical protein